MNTKRLIRKILFVSLWLAIGGGMLTLLIAAMGRQKKDHCRDYEITLKGAGSNFFIDEKDVEKLLKKAAKGNIKGQAKAQFHLQNMEKQLEKNVWIHDAEIYFDNRDVLHVTVRERVPVARIFDVVGKSFYIDESCMMMPLSDEKTADVPVFTGFPSKVISKRDSALLQDVKSISLHILNDPFWMAQIAQVDITSDRHFELYPVVGSHVVRLGEGVEIERKLHRLFVFYKNVLSKAGFNKYAAIDVQYAGQVIGVKETSKARIDSARLRYNVEKLLKQAIEIPTDEIMEARAVKDQQRISVDPVMSATENNSAMDNSPANSKPAASTSQQPKAVMGRVENNN